MNVIALTGSQAAVGLYGDPDETDEDTGKVSTRKAINDDKYELVFGVNYTGSFLN